MTQWQLDHAKAEDWLPTIEAASVDLVLVDPPYYKVKDEPWDRQWDTPAGFLSWLDGLAAEWQRVLKPNGSLYVFASPQMAARVEVLISERFNVLNHIVWLKDEDRGKHAAASKEAMRAYFPNTERIVFGEQIANEGAELNGYGYALGQLYSEIMQPLKDYLDGERQRAGLSIREVDTLTGTAMASHWFNHPSQWCLPTDANYERLRSVFNRDGGVFLTRDYYEVRREYDALRRVYEERRTHLEHLRRPFAVTREVPYTDVWRHFSPVPQYPGKHPCEKPLRLIQHIINTSTRPGALVLDCFAGSGNTGIAARQLGRRFIGCDYSATWATRGARRIADAALQQTLALPA